MWHTERGDRVLEDTEAKVFAGSLLDMIQAGLSDDSEFSAGIPVFDSLTYPQKIAVLHHVAHALFRQDVPMPELTAVLEGAVAAVFQNLQWLVEEEIQTAAGGETFLRKLISQACRNLEVEEVPRPSCDDPDEWSFCVECLHDAVLWDTDYLGEGNFVDLPPERSRALKAEMGVTDEYFLSLAPELPSGEVDPVLADLEALCLEVARSGRAKSTGTAP